VTIGANTADFTDLDPNTAYTLYFVAKDASGNFSPSPLSVTFSTLATGGGDTTPPVISNLALTGTTSTGSIGSFSSDENGTFYYVVLDS
jgi:chitodextrinase